MSYITFHDISYAQGKYNMDTDPSPVVEMKMSGFYYGSKQPYLDVQAASNYGNATRLGKIPLLYHFAGGHPDPRVEADYFINVACSPLADGDIYELDYELNDSMNPPADPDEWCYQFALRVKELTGKAPLFYIYTYLLNQHGNFPKTLSICSLIQANYGVSPDADIPGPPYIIQQYTDTPLDTNALFITLDTLKEYARHAQVQEPPAPPAPTPTPPPPTPVPVPDTPPPIVTPPVVIPPVVPPVPPVVPPKPPKPTFWQAIIAFLKALFGLK